LSEFAVTLAAIAEQADRFDNVLQVGFGGLRDDQVTALGAGGGQAFGADVSPLLVALTRGDLSSGRRTTEEVRGLMNLFRIFIRREGRELLRRNVRVRFIGDRGALDHDLAALMDELEARTAANTGLRLTVALNYGGRTEIVAAARHLAAEVAAGRIHAEDIDEGAFNAALWTDGLPDPDLLIRTSGEHRISNFLLWQAAYAEFYFTDVLWPDFGAEAFNAALTEFARRERRYGAVKT
jgi:undecaprenyl diphosphate synthase